MSVLGFVLSLVITGLVIGGLGRLVVPGPNPMSLWLTLAVGIVGAFVGGVITAIIGGGIVVAVVLEILVAAGLVVLISRRNTGRGLTR